MELRNQADWVPGRTAVRALEHTAAGRRAGAWTCRSDLRAPSSTEPLYDDSCRFNVGDPSGRRLSYAGRNGRASGPHATTRGFSRTRTRLWRERHSDPSKQLLWYGVWLMMFRSSRSPIGSQRRAARQDRTSSFRLLSRAAFRRCRPCGRIRCKYVGSNQSRARERVPVRCPGRSFMDVPSAGDASCTEGEREVSADEPRKVLDL